MDSLFLEWTATFLIPQYLNIFYIIESYFCAKFGTCILKSTMLHFLTAKQKETSQGEKTAQLKKTAQARLWNSW